MSRHRDYSLPVRCVQILLVHVLIQSPIRCIVLKNGIPIDKDSDDFSKHENYQNIYTEGSSHVSSWESHVLHLDLCEKRSLHDLTLGKWYKTDQGHYLFEPEACQLQRLSGLIARSCLDQKPIVFMGDSVTRYQYLNPGTYFLSKLERMEPYGAVPGIPSLCLERQWMDWDQFYHFTSAILGAAANGTSSELCDCVRGVDLAQTREFRTLLLHFPGECYTHLEQEGFLRVSYQQVFAVPDAVSAGKAAWTSLEALQEHTAPVHLVIFNMGLHIGSIGSDHQAILSQILEDGLATQSKQNATMLWKTTTPQQGGLFPFHHEEIAIAEEHNYDIYDVGRVVFASKQQGLNFYWDNLHYLPVVYEQFNDILLNSMCV